MFQKIIHSGNPLMRHIRAAAIVLWRLSLLITVFWGLAYLGYESALLLVVGLPWLIWLMMNKRNGNITIEKVMKAVEVIRTLYKY